MVVNLDKLFSKEAFTSLGTERVQLLKQFAQDLEGKSVPEVATLYMKLNQALSKDKPITAAERSAVVETIRESLPESEKAKFGQIIKMLNVR